MYNKDLLNLAFLCLKLKGAWVKIHVSYILTSSYNILFFLNPHIHLKDNLLNCFYVWFFFMLSFNDLD